jgi:hypothetical protein
LTFLAITDKKAAIRQESPPVTALDSRTPHAFARHAAMQAMRPAAPLAGTKRTCTRWADGAHRVGTLAPRSDRKKREVDSMDEVD